MFFKSNAFPRPGFSLHPFDCIGSLLIEAQDSVQTRAFMHGWVALNTSDRTMMVRVPQDQGLVDAQNNAAPATLTLEGHRGVIYRKR